MCEAKGIVSVLFHFINEKLHFDLTLSSVFVLVCNLVRTPRLHAVFLRWSYIALFCCLPLGFGGCYYSKKMAEARDRHTYTVMRRKSSGYNLAALMVGTIIITVAVLWFVLIADAIAEDQEDDDIPAVGGGGRFM
jgi:Ca2+/Na+ antiporter